MEDVVLRMAHVGARDNDREEVWAGGGLGDQTQPPRWAEGVVQSVWSQRPGDRHARRPSTVPPRRTAQTDAHSRAENVLITTQWVMAHQRSCRATAGPPRSSDLITCDNSLRGTGKISQLRLTSVEDLKTATWDCFHVQLSA